MVKKRYAEMDSHVKLICRKIIYTTIHQIRKPKILFIHTRDALR